MKNFISPEKLLSLKNPIIIDVRKDKDDYIKGHIEGAYYLNLDEDLSGVPNENTGKHPLPELEVFKKKLEETGATNESTFVLYDAGDNYSAPRGWFVLKYFGLDKVYVLSGGLKKAMEAGFKITTKNPEKKSGKLNLTSGNMPVVGFDEVLSYSEDPTDDKVLIDSRAYERYIGDVEPLYDVAGHIPGSKNIFYMTPYNEDGTLKSKEELESIFKKTKGYEQVILSCGSGVSACANLIAMDEIGLKADLYVGSYSEWLKRGKEVAKGDEEI